MTLRTITRGNSVFLAFTFYDEDDGIASVTSAEVQLTYMGRSDFVTETITLSHSGDEWKATWDSTAARPGWVDYHGHALANDSVYTQDGRFRLTGNRANLDHDTLPQSGASSDDYGGL
jgi:hypothetical protein